MGPEEDIHTVMDTPACGSYTPYYDLDGSLSNTKQIMQGKLVVMLMYSRTSVASYRWSTGH